MQFCIRDKYASYYFNLDYKDKKKMVFNYGQVLFKTLH